MFVYFVRTFTVSLNDAPMFVGFLKALEQNKNEVRVSSHYAATSTRGGRATRGGDRRGDRGRLRDRLRDRRGDRRGDRRVDRLRDRLTCDRSAGAYVRRIVSCSRTRMQHFHDRTKKVQR